MKSKALTGLVTAWAISALTACGGSENGNPDAGNPIDESCGIDCVAQEHYGLIADKCFEYGDTSLTPQDFPTIGAWVRPMRELEGGVKVMPVEYRQNGQIRMTDLFTIRDGDLFLARREFGAGESVTYWDSPEGNIVGVPFLRDDTGAGENYSATLTAKIVSGGQRSQDETTWTVNTPAASAQEQKVIAGEFPDALKLLIVETPQHGKNSTRVFAPGTGFIQVSSTFELVSTENAQPYYLHHIRTVPEADANCGMPE